MYAMLRKHSYHSLLVPLQSSIKALASVMSMLDNHKQFPPTKAQLSWMLMSCQYIVQYKNVTRQQEDLIFVLSRW